MDVKVLGTGCHDYLRLEPLVGHVLAELGVEASLSRIDDPRKIDHYVLARPPGPVINGELVSEGRMLAREEMNA